MRVDDSATTCRCRTRIIYWASMRAHSAVGEEATDAGADDGTAGSCSVAAHTVHGT